MTRAPRPASCTCGVLVCDGARLLLGQPPRFPLWDIPKGMAEPGEAFADAALRELSEETGLQPPPGALVDLGAHDYRREKRLALFAWPRPAGAMPDPATLRCRSFFRRPDGTRLPEFARFAVLPWEEALGRLGGNMARVLRAVRAGPLWPFPGPFPDPPPD